MRKILTVTALAVVLTAGLPAATASAAPHIRAWSAVGTISPYGKPHQCLAAIAAERDSLVYIEPCAHDDALENWTALQIAGVLSLFLTAHPDICVGGEPGPGGLVRTYGCLGGPDIEQGLFIKGYGGIFAGPTGLRSTIKNTGKRYMLNGGGIGPLIWGGRFTRIRGHALLRFYVFNGGWEEQTVD